MPSDPDLTEGRLEGSCSSVRCETQLPNSRRRVRSPSPSGFLSSLFGTQFFFSESIQGLPVSCGLQLIIKCTTADAWTFLYAFIYLQRFQVQLRLLIGMFCSRDHCAGPWPVERMELKNLKLPRRCLGVHAT